MAQLGNLDVKVGWLDCSAGPDGLHDGVLRDQVPVSLNQQSEQIECARPKRDRLGSAARIQPKQDAAVAIEAEALERENVGRTALVHPLDPQ
jgi:hypothetical protein